MKKNRKLIPILILLIITLSIFIFYKNNEKIELVKDIFQLEYGEVISLDAKNVLDTKKTDVLDSFKIDYSNMEMEEGKNYPKIGSYDVEISYNLHNRYIKEKVKFIIEDTTKPEFTKCSEKIEIGKGFAVQDLKSYFDAKDLSPFEIEVDTKNLDTSRSGEYELEVSAIDMYKNKSVKKVKVIVMEEEPEPTKLNSHVNEKPAESTEAKDTPYTVRMPRYVNGIIIVNKKNPIPYNYAPYENAEASNQVRNLIKEMQGLGYDINNSYSGYRSFHKQEGLYQNYVNNHGQLEADTFSARAGYSEHQTGLAFDLLHKDGSLVQNSNEVNWIAQNANRYGFIVRYKAGKEHITGYQAEPWHIRYVGSIATAIYNSGLTLEEYLGVQGGGY